MIVPRDKASKKNTEVLPPKPPTIKAYKFVNHIRNESILSKETSKDPVRFSKEEEVMKIGQGLENRISSALKVNKPKTSKTSKVF